MLRAPTRSWHGCVYYYDACHCFSFLTCMLIFSFIVLIVNLRVLPPQGSYPSTDLDRLHPRFLDSQVHGPSRPAAATRVGSLGNACSLYPNQSWRGGELIQASRADEEGSYSSSELLIGIGSWIDESHTPHRPAFSLDPVVLRRMQYARWFALRDQAFALQRAQGVFALERYVCDAVVPVTERLFCRSNILLWEDE
jgi:hypothetical protein